MAETFTPDRLHAGSFPRATKKVTVLTGRNLARGTVVGRITIGAVTTGFAGTGNGTITMDATTPVLANAIPGAYKAVCITAGTDSATFRVYDPKGRALGDVALAGTFANQIKFVIADGATDFTVGATFTITLAAGSGKMKAVDSSAVDGSAEPYGVLVDDTDATSADKSGVVELTGEFNEDALIFGGADTKETHRMALEAKHIFLRAVSNAN